MKSLHTELTNCVKIYNGTTAKGREEDRSEEENDESEDGSAEEEEYEEEDEESQGENQEEEVNEEEDDENEGEYQEEEECKEEEPSQKKKKIEARPPDKVRYDKVSHWAEHDAIGKLRSTCKFESCKSLTNVYCTKCNVHCAHLFFGKQKLFPKISR